MGWTNIVIEGHCVASWGADECPCGQSSPTDFCLLSGHCPHFGYTVSNERDATWFVPLRLIIWDRIESISGDIWTKVTWHIWHRWFFQKKWDEFLRNMKVAECPSYDEMRKKSVDKFPKWFKKAKGEEAQYNSQPKEG